MESYNRYCVNKARNSGSSFYASFLFLNPQQYQAICAVYAYCREVDDVVDENRSIDAAFAEKQLDDWALEIERVFENGQPQHPVGLALRDARQHYNFSKIHFDKILQGMRLDLHPQIFQTLDSLLIYCEHVASAVGLLSIQIFGFRDDETQEFARLLGIAIQLVNIIRDVKEDALRGRIYIPQELCQKFQVTQEEILNLQDSNRFRLLMQNLAEIAREYYAQAKLKLSKRDILSQKISLMMGEIYFKLLAKIEASGFKVLVKKHRIALITKFYLAWKTNRAITLLDTAS